MFLLPASLLECYQESEQLKHLSRSIKKDKVMAKVRYQDYVIKDGKFVGDFEGMYKVCENPWLQSDDDNVFESRKVVAKNWIKKIALKSNVRVCEIGCGFGHITAELTKEGISCIGSDISPTAIEKAKALNQNCEFFVANFGDFDFYASKI